MLLLGGGLPLRLEAILHNGSARISSRSLPRPPFMSITELCRRHPLAWDHRAAPCARGKKSAHQVERRVIEQVDPRQVENAQEDVGSFRVNVT